MEVLEESPELSFDAILKKNTMEKICDMNKPKICAVEPVCVPKEMDNSSTEEDDDDNDDDDDVLVFEKPTNQVHGLEYLFCKHCR
mmetsp:Transcript_5321/g.6078  ORF Transcript_5321/g.6078 Transcript_5321/m.6078 type:complete len:85 (+) Transcript_5321:1070-1324(+)